MSILLECPIHLTLFELRRRFPRQAKQPKKHTLSALSARPFFRAELFFLLARRLLAPSRTQSIGPSI